MNKKMKEVKIYHKGKSMGTHLEDKHWYWITRKGYDHGGKSGFLRHLVVKEYENQHK